MERYSCIYGNDSLFGTLHRSYAITDSFISNDKTNQLYNEIETLRLDLGDKVASKVDLNNFDVSSYEVVTNFEGEYLLKMFGIEKFTQNCLTESTYKNVMLGISESDARLILDKTRVMNNCELDTSLLTKDDMEDEISYFKKIFKRI